MAKVVSTRAPQGCRDYEGREEVGLFMSFTVKVADAGGSVVGITS
jgi:hypothetical protein